MSDAGDALSPIEFTFEYQGHGRALASISDGTVTYCMDPSYALGDPLALLLQAVVQTLRKGDDVTGCEWWYEPSVDRWTLCREGDSVHITIRRRSDWRSHHHTGRLVTCQVLVVSVGEVRFTATGDLWTFAAQVRRAVNRLKTAGDDDPTWPRTTVEYRALCDFLDEHKRTQQPPSDPSER